MFLAGLLPIFLFTLATDVSVLRTVGNSNNIKKILSNSGIYNSIVSSTLNQSKQITGGGSDVPLSDPAVQAAAEAVVTPQFLRQTTETVINSTYEWLDGATPVPDFQIDLTSLKAAFAAQVAKAVTARASSLPACAADSGQQPFNVFGATCLPKGVSPASVAGEVQKSIVNGQGFLNTPTVTADSIKTGGSNQSVYADQLKNAPQVYQKAKKTPAILAILSLVIIVGIVLLSTSRWRGLRRAGITLLGVGIVVLIFAWGLNYSVNQKVLPNLNLNNQVLQEKVKVFLSDLTQNVDKTYWIVGGVYAGVGTLAIAGSIFIHKRRDAGQTRTDPAHHEIPIEDTPATESHENESHSKKKIKIQ